MRSISRVPRCQLRNNSRLRRSSRPPLDRVDPVIRDSCANAKSPDVPGGVDIASGSANVSSRMRCNFRRNRGSATRSTAPPSLRAKRSNPRSSRQESRKQERKSGLLRRYAPRNDVKTQIRDPAARCARALKHLSPEEGVGNAGCPLHPQPRAQSVIKHTSVVTTGPPEHPAFPHAMVLTAYFGLSPATNSSCHRHRIKVLSDPVGPTCLRRLDTSNACQDHTVLPSAHAPFVSAPSIAHGK